MPASLAYEVAPHEKEIRANVVIVLMESMGSEFFSEFRDDGQKLTPELEKLASESLYFSHVYSTGTRTVRGIEALTLARPPLPGMPIVRLQGNDNLRGIWSVFRERGYDTKWIYGGYGYERLFLRERVHRGGPYGDAAGRDHVLEYLGRV